MKVKKKESVQGDWAKIKEDINNGDIVTIQDEGKVITGEYGDRSVFNIKTKNGERLLSFNQTTMNYIIDALGDETAQWIGKEVKVWIVKSNVGGKMRDVVYLTAPDWVEREDGFYPPDGDDIPTIDDDDDIAPENIPF